MAEKEEKRAVGPPDTREGWRISSGNGIESEMTQWSAQPGGLGTGTDGLSCMDL